MSRLMKCMLLTFTISLILTGCKVNRDNREVKEVSVSIEASIDETIENTDAEGSVPYKFMIKQVMSDDSIREYTGVIHVNPDGTLFTYGHVDNNVDGLISVIQAKNINDTNTDEYQKVLVMRSNFDQKKDNQTYLHEIKWEKDHFVISKQKIAIK